MRQVLIAATGLALAACADPPSAAGAGHRPKLEPIRPTTDEHGFRRIFSVDTLQAVCSGTRFTLTASVSTDSGGWSEQNLRPLGREDDVLTYEVVGKGPAGPAVSMMMQIFMLKHEDALPNGVNAVRVKAEQNEMTVSLDCTTAG